MAGAIVVGRQEGMGLQQQLSVHNWSKRFRQRGRILETFRETDAETGQGTDIQTQREKDRDRDGKRQRQQRNKHTQHTQRERMIDRQTARQAWTFVTSKPFLTDISFPTGSTKTRLCLPILLKQFQYLWTKLSNVWAFGALSHSNHRNQEASLLRKGWDGAGQDNTG